jgi:ATP-dependent RNA helicase DDX10/DBP4
MDRLPRHPKAKNKKNAKAPPKFKFATVARKEKRQDEVQEIESLEARIEAGKPDSGTNPLASELPAADIKGVLAPYVGAKLFDQLPLSEKTKRGLRDGNFTRMTAIQRAALPHALCGRDVLGAAKTGSGKTLAFLIPVIEKLYRLRWGSMDGVGAIIISPTRELSVQIFDVLRKLGKHHSFSGGLLIGGRKDVETEKDCVNALNILVCTPGRLLQHMDETPLFDCSQLQVLVLDEADRILDMGFSKSLNAIVSQLPRKRQTLLFSATQTRSVQDLARLSLKDPEYLAVHAESAVATPARLQQTAIIVPLEQKLDMLWSFIKTHLNAKILVFLSSCKQVKFVYESFKKLRPGIPVRCLHGRMKQTQRMLVLFNYTEEKHSLLFATDVASRGLDFPAIDWVVQVDCPEDVPSYIHRVGRTARFNAGGRSVAFFMPSEMKMLMQLHEAKIPVKVIKANASKLQSVSAPLAALLSKDPDLKYMAQRAFVTYLRSIHLRPDKEIFDVSKLPIEDYSVSLGLPTAPRIRFLKKSGSKLKNMEDTVCAEHEHKPEDSEGSENEDVSADGADKDFLQNVTNGESKQAKQCSKLDNQFNNKNTSVLSPEYEKRRSRNEDKGDDAFLTKKRPVEDGDTEATSLATRILKKKKLKINISKPAGQRFVFDEEGKALPPLAAFANRQGGGDEEEQTTVEERYIKLREEMKLHDKEDKLLLKQRLRERRTKERQKIKRQSREDERDYESDASGSQSEEGGSVYNNTKKSKKVYFKSDSSDDDETDELDPRKKKKVKLANVKTGSMSIAEQEALALELLSSRR